MKQILDDAPDLPVSLLSVNTEELASALADADRKTSRQPGTLPRDGARKHSVIHTVTLYPYERKTRLLRQVMKRKQRKRAYIGRVKRRHTLISSSIVGVLLFSMLIPLITSITAYTIYNHARVLALGGINHLMTVKELFPDAKNNPMSVLDVKKLTQAKYELVSAQNNFEVLQHILSSSTAQTMVEQVAPQYTTTLVAAQNMLKVALDTTQMGQELSDVAIIAARVLHGSPLAGGDVQPLLSANDITSIEGTLTHAQYSLSDIQTQMSQVHMQALPLSANQQIQITGLITQLPNAQKLLGQAQQLIEIGAWLLGVDHERNFLVQTMDRAELRPGGGFTGQYGVLHVQNGRMGSLSLTDVARLDYGGNGVELGRSAPPEYRSWMNFGNWGLRDSNLSADYPTTAHLGMQVFQDEGGGPVDGDISFTPTFIGHILDVTGPIYIAEYHETITSQNLEARLHYYQQNYTAIALERAKTNDTSHQARKAFTSLVGKLLLERVRHLFTTQLLTIIKGAIKDIQARDLEIYFANPQAEAWLVRQGYSGAMNSFSQQDGFMVVQANISISKASSYVHTTEHDDVTLDAQGGATHTLTLTLDYQQTGPVYGFDTYADYIRVYAPASAQFLGGDGFDSGQPLCNTGTCGTISPALRYCPDGNYDLGDRYYQQPWTLNQLGAPTSLTSDLPDRAMFGGLTETPKNCISTFILSWYVPHVITTNTGHPVYTLLVGKQGGYIPTVELAVNTQAFADRGMRALNVKKELMADTSFRMA